jgi:hypothetical protein
MKRNPEYLLRDVADSHVLVPVGAAVSLFAGMITLNPTGCVLWELLAEDQTVEGLTAALLERYEVTEEQARADVEKFLQTLEPTGAILP